MSDAEWAEVGRVLLVCLPWYIAAVVIAWVPLGMYLILRRYVR